MFFEYPFVFQILCLMLEWQIVEASDQCMQIITTLQSTPSGKKKYQALCDRQLHLQELVSTFVSLLYPYVINNAPKVGATFCWWGFVSPPYFRILEMRSLGSLTSDLYILHLLSYDLDLKKITFLLNC